MIIVLSKVEITRIAMHESYLLLDYKKANNYIGIKTQKAKIELLDKILEVPNKEEN